MSRFSIPLFGSANIGTQINGGNPPTSTRHSSGAPNVGSPHIVTYNEILLRNRAYDSPRNAIESLNGVTTGFLYSIWDLVDDLPGVKNLFPEDVAAIAGFLNPDGGFNVGGKDVGDVAGKGVTGGAQGSAIVQIARNEVGTIERASDHGTKYHDWYGISSSQPWCAVFVSWCFNRVGFENEGGASLLRHALTPAWVRIYQDAGRWTQESPSASPDPGDIIFFNFNTGNDASRIASYGNPVDHVGLVASANADGTITCIEGNTGGNSQNNGGEVQEKIRNRNTIYGWGKPPYDEQSARSPGADRQLNTSDDVIVVNSGFTTETGSQATGGAVASLSGYVTSPGSLNGKLTDDMLTIVDDAGNKLQKSIAASWIAMREAAKADNVNLVIGNSYRTYARQVELANELGLYSQGGLAAAPGSSNHGWGGAVDLSRSGRDAQVAWLDTNASRFGWFNHIREREPWHWSVTGR